MIQTIGAYPYDSESDHFTENEPEDDGKSVLDGELTQMSHQILLSKVETKHKSTHLKFDPFVYGVGYIMKLLSRISECKSVPHFLTCE